MPFIFNNRAVSHLEKKISASDTAIQIARKDYDLFNRYAAGGEDFMFCVLRGPESREIIKIIPDESTYGPEWLLICERGQGGTDAQAWPAGTLIFLSTTADHYNSIIQRGNIRTVGFNPNGVISPLYQGEKILQDLGCGVRWWQSFNDADPYWHLIAGEPCEGETFENPTGFFVSDVWMPGILIEPTWLPMTKERYPTGPQYWQAGALTFFNNTGYYWQAAGSPPLTVILDVYRNGGPDLRANWPIELKYIRGFKIHTSNGLPIPKVEIDAGPGPPGWELCTKQFLNVPSGSEIEFNLPLCDPGYTSDELYGIRIEVNAGQNITLIEVKDASGSDLWRDLALKEPIGFDPLCFQVSLGAYSFDAVNGWGFVPGFSGGYQTLILSHYVNPGTIDYRTVCTATPNPPEQERSLQYIKFTDVEDATFQDIEIYITWGPEGSIPWLNSDCYGKHSVKMSDLDTWQEQRIDYYKFNFNEWKWLSQIILRSPTYFKITKIEMWDNGQ